MVYEQNYVITVVKFLFEKVLNEKIEWEPMNAEHYYVQKAVESKMC